MLRAVPIGILSSTLALAAGGPLETALAKMDQAAATFKDLSADLKKTHYTAVIGEQTYDTGTILIKRPKPHELLMRLDMKEPEPRQLAVDARKAEIYYPKNVLVQEYEIGKYKKLADQLLLLGFGTTSKDLAEGYSIALGGSEEVNGQKTTLLELTPKSNEMHLRKVQLWISDTTGLAVQQKFEQNGGDYDLATFTNMKINPNLPNSALKLDIPKGAKREYPQN
jgi:outer membrane lipoprotein-sorting protein